MLIFKSFFSAFRNRYHLLGVIQECFSFFGELDRAGRSDKQLCI